MQICITQIDGIRHFSRFKNIPEKDRLEIELTIEEGRQKVFNFDLTDSMFEQFEKYPEILHKKRILPKDDLLEDRPAKKRVTAAKPAHPTAKNTKSPDPPDPAAEGSTKKNKRKKTITENNVVSSAASSVTPVKTRAKKASDAVLSDKPAVTSNKFTENPKSTAKKRNIKVIEKVKKAGIKFSS
ncbi:MAG: hypothetical protein ABFD46_10960 [Armatimonadota bacterium]